MYFMSAPNPISHEFYVGVLFASRKGACSQLHGKTLCWYRHTAVRGRDAPRMHYTYYRLQDRELLKNIKFSTQRKLGPLGETF